MRNILVVDDEAAVRFGLRDFLESNHYAVVEAATCREAEEACRVSRPDAAIVDYSLPDGNALNLLARLRGIDPSLPVIVLTAHGSIELAVQAIKEGAENFLTKPAQLPTVLVLLQRLLETDRHRRRQLAGRSREEREEIDPFAGTSPSIWRLAEQAQRVLSTERPVLILGETGTGKGVLARWLHRKGPRAEEPFVDINCAALARDLLESELFGHERGAFTGAVSSKPGLLEVSHQGTAFLDEIGDTDLPVQVKLLKVLEEKRIRRVGDVRDRLVDVRLITATHQDLRQLVQEKRFRNDLYFRINGIPLVVPALRERLEDIPLLAGQLLRRFASEMGHGEKRLTPDAEQALRAYRWPGNIRELRNVLERAVLLSQHEELTPRDLTFDTLGPESGGSDTKLTLLELERHHIQRVLEEERGHVERAAQRLGVPRSTLYAKIKQFGITTSRIQGSA